MVTCKLVGRLANQCFQIANCISYSIEHGHEYHIPIVSTNERAWPATFKHLANEKYSRFANEINIYEKGHDYHEIPYDEAWKDSNIVLNGYFQSELYFEDYIDEVRAALGIPYVRQEGFVGVHVRRGDYVTQFPDKHPSQPYAYYRDAVAYFVEHGYKSFAVCSDDIKWCKEKFPQIKKEIPSIEFTYVEGQTPLLDMSLLSSCDHAVIANSSFSLFAFILNQNPDKFCIAPKQWFGSGNRHLSEASIYPKNCVKL